MPDHVDPPASVDLRGRQRRVAHADHAVHRLAPDQHVLPPACAAVRRAEGVDGAVVRGVRNDDGSVRLHDGLAAKPRGSSGNRLTGPQVAPPSVVVAIRIALPAPLSSHCAVAVAVVRARGPCVAGDPGLVPERPGRLGSGDGVRPGQPSVSGAVDEQDDAGSARVDPEAESEPDVVLRVIGDGGIADARPGPGRGRVDRRSGEAAGDPGSATVLRRREDVVARAATCEVPTRLRRGDDRLPEGERVRLDLRLVLWADVRVRVLADRERKDAPGRDRRHEEQPESRRHGNRREASSPQPSLPHGLSILIAGVEMS